MAKKKAVAAGPPAPKGLSVEAGKRWAVYNGEYEFDAVQLHVLEAALEAFDRMRQAQAEIRENNGRVTFEDRWGQVKPHPAVAVEAQSREQYTRLIDKLGLDLEPLHDGPGRPAGS
jgi:phage terminase small subunit